MNPTDPTALIFRSGATPSGRWIFDKALGEGAYGRVWRERTPEDTAAGRAREYRP